MRDARAEQRDDQLAIWHVDVDHDASSSLARVAGFSRAERPSPTAGRPVGVVIEPRSATDGFFLTRERVNDPMTG